MSTRRARIKAVTSLPPRRKNNDEAKAKISEKDPIEKPIKSPRTPRGAVKTQENVEKNSPKPVSPLKSPRPVNNVLKSQIDRVPPPAVTTEITKDVVTPKRSEKVSVITNIFSLKSNVFVSPKSVGSPIRKPVASPLIQSSKVDINIPKVTQITPEKLPEPEKPKQKSVEDKTLENGKINGKTRDICKNATTTNATADSRNEGPDDYNVLSVAESITEDAVMDGIVPLQPVASAPKPLALLKNEIISENAEVLFDPIVPLPSPSKVRPKLRPVPRLAPLRRNSVQGSASESEDESRRALLSGGSSTPAPPRQRHDSHTSHSTMHSLPNREVVRVRNDSVCSSISQATTQPPATASPIKDKHVSKSRRVDMSRRMAAMRRRRETVKRDTLTMYDLIFYNPSSNPIIPDQDELKAKEANEKQEAVRNSTKETEDEDASQSTDAAPVPQIKLGPNGEIMLDEQSLVIKQSDNRKVSSGVVHEGAWGGISSGRYRRTPRTAEWSDAETVRFYRALAALGTDFMLMEQLFPGRTRRDLKLKFKKEERVNMAQLDKALRTSSKWDATRLENEFQAEREAAERRAKAEAERLRQRARDERQRQKDARDLRVRMSRGSKALDSSILPENEHINENDFLTADDIVQRHNDSKERKRKPRQPPTLQAKPQPLELTTQIDKEFATLTKIASAPTAHEKKSTNPDMATIRKLDPTKSNKTPDQKQPPTPQVPSNIENGSLVVLTVNDPNSPSKKMLQTYIASGGGRLTPVALPTSFLNSVVTYMKKGTPKSTISAGSSPHLTSPSSVASQDSRACSTPGVIQMNSSPAKRQRHSSYTITQL